MSECSFVICGFGRVGSAVAASGRRSAPIVVELDPTRAQSARRQGFRTVEANGRNPASLRVANVGQADCVIVCTADMHSAAVVAAIRLVARDTLIRVAVRRREFVEPVEAAGADHILFLPRLTGELLAQSALDFDV